MRRYSCTCGCGNIIESLIGKIIAGDFREIASRLYQVGVTRPWTCPCHCREPNHDCHYTSHGFSANENGRRTPNVECRDLWDRWKLWQFRTYWSTCFRISFQLYSLSRSSNIFALPGCPASAVSWCSCTRRKQS